MILWLLAGFILVPLVELYLLLQLAHATSAGLTILIVIFTGMLGTYLARREGMATWFRFRSGLAKNRVPGREIQDGLMIAFAAALLLTPGLLTDALGFALLFPPSRDVIRRTIIAKVMKGMNVTVVSQSMDMHSQRSTYDDDGPVIDATAVDKTSS